MNTRHLCVIILCGVFLTPAPGVTAVSGSTQTAHSEAGSPALRATAETPDVYVPDDPRRTTFGDEYIGLAVLDSSGEVLEGKSTIDPGETLRVEIRLDEPPADDADFYLAVNSEGEELRLREESEMDRGYSEFDDRYQSHYIGIEVPYAVLDNYRDELSGDLTITVNKADDSDGSFHSRRVPYVDHFSLGTDKGDSPSTGPDAPDRDRTPSRESPDDEGRFSMEISPTYQSDSPVTIGGTVHVVTNVTNIGGETKTENVSLFVNESGEFVETGTQSVTLDPGESLLMTFTHELSAVSEGQTLDVRVATEDPNDLATEYTVSLSATDIDLAEENRIDEQDFNVQFRPCNYMTIYGGNINSTYGLVLSIKWYPSDSNHAETLQYPVKEPYPIPTNTSRTVEEYPQYISPETGEGNHPVGNSGELPRPYTGAITFDTDYYDKIGVERMRDDLLLVTIPVPEGASGSGEFTALHVNTGNEAYTINNPNNCSAHTG